MAGENKDYWAAFAIGAIVGIGATLLLAPEETDGARRILHQIEPALRRARRGGRRIGKGVRSAARGLSGRGKRGRRVLRFM